MARLGINIDNHHSLKNRLKQIKRWVVSPELRAEKQRVTSDLEAALDGHAGKLRGFAGHQVSHVRRRSATRWKRPLRQNTLSFTSPTRSGIIACCWSVPASPSDLPPLLNNRARRGVCAGAERIIPRPAGFRAPEIRCRAPS